ncbi:MAG: AAC(3) family N-acetyltransferase [Armatimonadia bacterium]
MRPETGDRTISVTVDDVAAGVRSVGIGPGDLVMFHSSLSSMGNVVGGPNTVIEGFLKAVAPDGTVAVPTLWWNGTQDLKDWDYDNSPSYPGIITETFRQRPDSIRSNNPTHSVSAIGPRAAELTADHGKWGLRPCMYGDGAFAEASPWERLYLWDAHYCFLGVDFTVNTMGHYCQCRLIEWALEQAPPEKHDDLLSRISRWQSIVDYYEASRENPPRTLQFMWPSFSFKDMGEHLADLGLVRFGKIGSATIRAISSRQMVDTIMATIIAEPDKWLVEHFRPWWHEAVS